MSLLLDARKKLQQAQAASQEDGPHASDPASGHLPEEAGANQTGARGAGQNLFAAKFPPGPGLLPNRNLLYALGGTLLLLAGGMIYLWQLDSANSTTPLASSPPVPPPRVTPAAAPEPVVAQSAPLADPGRPDASEKPQPAAPSTKATAAPQPHGNPTTRKGIDPVSIEPKKTDPVNPLLADAYLAYRSGRLEEAQQLYLEMLQKDAHNPDVLLGLATIAEQRGENRAAAQYFGRVLALDPRNAAANAGMSALSADLDYSESRLKNLLREQSGSAALHFALGNLYAGQSRWGEAQQTYFNAYMLEPGNAEYAFNLAVSLDHLGQGKLAAQHYQRAMQLDPSRSAGFDHAQTSQRAQELMR